MESDLNVQVLQENEARIQTTKNERPRSKRDVVRITSILTGHWPVGEHAANLAIPYTTPPIVAA